MIWNSTEGPTWPKSKFQAASQRRSHHSHSLCSSDQRGILRSPRPLAVLNYDLRINRPGFIGTIGKYCIPEEQAPRNCVERVLFDLCQPVVPNSANPNILAVGVIRGRRGRERERGGQTSRRHYTYRVLFARKFWVDTELFHKWNIGIQYYTVNVYIDAERPIWPGATWCDKIACLNTL